MASLLNLECGPYLIQAVVQEDNLCAGLCLVDQYIAWMGVTVDVAVHKYHLTIQLGQVLHHLKHEVIIGYRPLFYFLVHDI